MWRNVPRCMCSRARSGCGLPDKASSRCNTPQTHMLCTTTRAGPWPWRTCPRRRCGDGRLSTRTRAPACRRVSVTSANTCASSRRAPGRSSSRTCGASHPPFQCFGTVFRSGQSNRQIPDHCVDLGANRQMEPRTRARVTTEGQGEGTTSAWRVAHLQLRGEDPNLPECELLVRDEL